jgi:hypothetical protein
MILSRNDDGKQSCRSEAICRALGCETGLARDDLRLRIQIVATVGTRGSFRVVPSTTLNNVWALERPPTGSTRYCFTGFVMWNKLPLFHLNYDSVE